MAKGKKGKMKMKMMKGDPDAMGDKKGKKHEEKKERRSIKMAKKNWISKAIKHPGALKAKAKKAGMSLSKYESKVSKKGSKASSQTKRQVNLAKTLGRMRGRK